MNNFQIQSLKLKIVCPFVLFLLAIALSVLLLFTASEYPFGICTPLKPGVNAGVPNWYTNILGIYRLIT
jgi:hypothetical protein